MTKYLAHTIKGLESITQDELQDKIRDIHIHQTSQKKIIFESSEIFKDPSIFRTFDDLSIFVVSKEFENTEDILLLIDTIKFEDYRNSLSQIRKLDNTYSITISTYKNNDVDKKYALDGLSRLISHKYSWEYTPLIHSNFDIRIQIEKNTVLILIKVYSQSLFFRKYRSSSQKGAISPAIAGAMLYHLTNGNSGYKIVDNFCGSGTFLCEGLLDGNEVFGGDISTDSVKIAEENLQSISKGSQIKELDAQKTNWQNSYFDIAISNLPWDKQIKTDHFTKLYSEAIKEYGRILKPNGSLALIGSKPDLMIKYVKQIFPDRKSNIEIFKIGYLGQTPTVVFLK